MHWLAVCKYEEVSLQIFAEAFMGPEVVGVCIIMMTNLYTIRFPATAAALRRGGASRQIQILIVVITRRKLLV